MYEDGPRAKKVKIDVRISLIFTIYNKRYQKQSVELIIFLWS